MKSLKVLKNNLATHRSDLTLLFQKADELQARIKKSRNPDLNASIAEILEVVESLRNGQDKRIKLFTTTTRQLQQYEMMRLEPISIVANQSISTQTIGIPTQLKKSKNIGLQTPF